MSGEPAYATAPFDHTKADIILRASDNVDFRVFKLFLSLASPFFETLFDIPQPAQVSEDQEIKDGLVVVPVTEDSKTLDALLRFCYPCTLADDPNIEVLQDAMYVLEAARKYSLDAIEKKARQAISNPKILEAEPLRCFAIAHRGRLREETLLAARYTLTQPLIPSWFQEIELITATDLLSLLTYHRKCGDAVYALRLNLSWITSHYESAEACSWLSGKYRTHYNNSDCGCSRQKTMPRYVLGFRTYNGDSESSLQWWEDFLEETFLALRDKPCKETVQAAAEKTAQSVKARNCEACSPRVTEGMRDFSDLFARKVEEVVSQVNCITYRHSSESLMIFLTDRAGVGVLNELELELGCSQYGWCQGSVLCMFCVYISRRGLFEEFVQLSGIYQATY
ncbi:hypothetical protein J3R83DRAFT_8526 [Lanmaoa asiatica]|nr:hypothetical protein J3R83DRAFT_8526 [Lanmaoa asiatica]